MFRPCSRILPLLFAVLIFSPFCAAAKPTPPANLMKVFAQFLQGEDLIEENDKAGIDKWLSEVEKQYQPLRPQLSKEVPAGDLENFEQAMIALREGNATQNQDRKHDLFLTMHKSFFKLLDDFDYKSPPLMYLVQNDLNEVDAAIKGGDTDEIEDELKEVELFYGQAVPALKARGIGNEMIDNFKAQLVRCKGAYAAKDMKLLATEVAKLQQFFSIQNRQLNSK